MNCATHNDTAAVAFCRTCGKPLCANCTRDVRGVVYCEPCLAARLEGTTPAAAYVPPQAVYPPVGIPAGPRHAGSGPNPTVAGILAGFFPFGVGAVYCSQYAKGLAHLLIFGLLIFASDHAGNLDFVFGIGIAFFYVYQIIDAVRTARALQEGQPPPDPFGLAQAFSMGEKGESKNIPVVAVVLIGLGVLFLLHTMNILEFGLDRFWPLILIVLGGWMFARQWGMIGAHPAGCTCTTCRVRTRASYASRSSGVIRRQSRWCPSTSNPREHAGRLPFRPWKEVDSEACSAIPMSCSAGLASLPSRCRAHSASPGLTTRSSSRSI